MMKKAIALSLLGLVLGFSALGFVGKNNNYNLVCVKESNTWYVIFPTGIAPLVNAGNRPIACGGE